MRRSRPLSFVALALILAGCGGGSGPAGSSGTGGAETLVGPVAVRTVGDGLRKPVIVNSGEATFVGLAGATMTSVALINPSASRIGVDPSNLAYLSPDDFNLEFVHPLTKRRRVIYRSNSFLGSVSVSPDGYRVAMADNGSIRVINIDGSAPVVYTNPGNLSDYSGPRFSPDGSQVLFRGGLLGSGLFRAPSGGGTVTPILTGSIFDATFDVTGTRVLVSRSGEAIKSYNLLGGNEQMVSTSVTARLSDPGFGGYLYATQGSTQLWELTATNTARVLVTRSSADRPFALHPNLPFAMYSTTSISPELHAMTGTNPMFPWPDVTANAVFMPHVERRNVVATGSADPQVAGFVASMLGRYAGSIVGYDAQTRNATAIVAEPSDGSAKQVVYTVDAGANNKITRIFSLDSVWEVKSTVPVGQVDGFVVSFDAATGLPAAIIPYTAVRAGGKPKIMRTPDGGVRVEGELLGVYGEGGKTLSGPVSSYEVR